MTQWQGPYGEQLTLDGLLGETLKQEGMGQALTHAPDLWLRQAWVAMEGLALSGEPFTSEDLVELVGLPRVTEGMNRNNAVGAVFAAASRKGLIKQAGWRKPTRPALHASDIRVWLWTGEPF